MQMTALALLVLVLFPVVSLTDDLLACSAPSEVEHLVRRDLQNQPSGHVNSVAVMIAALFSNPHAIGFGILSRPPLSIKVGTPREASLEVLGNRPPPRA